jgi:hypothetical protein
MPTRRPLLIAFLSLCLLMLSACGGGGGGHFIVSGTLEVQNDFASFWSIEYIEAYDSFRGELHSFNVLLFPGESFFVDLLPGSYEVLVVYEDGASFFFPDVDIFEGRITTVTTLH